MVFTSLAHHIDITMLAEAYRLTRKGAAPGIDGQRADAYATELDDRLASLLERFKSGRYHAPPVRRVRIPKSDGRETRPIGVPTFEDKILQRAVALVLQAVYEQDFLPCSYGFRPRRSAHQALEALWQRVMKMGGGWVVDIDIQSFFDTLDHRHLRSFLDTRVRDGVLRRAIDKWLNAGVLEDGQMHRPQGGTPQGGVISPLLANIYLHVVLDEWFEHVVKPRLRGEAFLIRYADDCVIVCSRKDDARQVMEMLPERFGAFGLRLHPDKTKLVSFKRPSRRSHDTGSSGARPSERPGTFDLLGFTHYWGKSRKGRSVVKRRTAATSMRRSLRAISLWLRHHRHDTVAQQHQALSTKLCGHYAYFGITGNAQRLQALRWQVEGAWHKWLNRRSQRSNMCWERFERLLHRYPLPAPVVVHSVYRRVAKPC
jgi:group II intron reverse transcriptase/maturase